MGGRWRELRRGGAQQGVGALEITGNATKNRIKHEQGTRARIILKLPEGRHGGIAHVYEDPGS